MSINLIKLDIITLESGVIAHGVNCRGVMNAGIAKAIRNKWPKVFEQYEERGIGDWLLGYADPVFINDDLWIMNCYTQRLYGKDGRFADPNAVNDCIDRACYLARSSDMPLFMPRIGCGLGGLDWETDVLPSVLEWDQYYEPITINVCEKP